VRWRARTIVQRDGARRASRPQLKRDPLGSHDHHSCAPLTRNDVSTRVSLNILRYALGFLAACHGAGHLPAASDVPKPRRTPIRPDWCVAANERVDSAFAVEKARQVLQDSLLPLKPASVRSVGEQSLLDGFPMFEGFLVTLAPTRLVAGGGGLVWVDGETGCAILLKRYE